MVLFESAGCISGVCAAGAVLVAAGYSLGANILTRYLGEEGAAAPLAAAASLCNPFNLVRRPPWTRPPALDRPPAPKEPSHPPEQSQPRWMNM